MGLSVHPHTGYPAKILVLCPVCIKNASTLLLQKKRSCALVYELCAFTASRREDTVHCRLHHWLPHKRREKWSKSYSHHNLYQPFFDYNQYCSTLSSSLMVFHFCCSRHIRRCKLLLDSRLVWRWGSLELSCPITCPTSCPTSCSTSCSTSYRAEGEEAVLARASAGMFPLVPIKHCYFYSKSTCNPNSDWCFSCHQIHMP